MNVITILESSRSGQAPRSRARAIAFHHAGGYVFIGLFALMVWFMDQASRWLPGGNLTRCRRTRRSWRFTCSASIRKVIIARKYKNDHSILMPLGHLFPPDSRALNPEEVVLQNHNGAVLRKALEMLPTNFREVLILRELEEMSYREIAEITGMPAGTVMSSLSRARGRLRQALTGLMNLDTMSGPPQIGTAT